MAYPDNPCLWGRILTVRIKSPVSDYIIGGVYVPPCLLRSPARKIAIKVHSWLQRHLRAMPCRCTPIIAIDANGHVGSFKCSAFGDHAKSRENANGTLLRETCTSFSLRAMNTFYDVGSTFYSQDVSSESIVDYVLLPASAIAKVLEEFILT